MADGFTKVEVTVDRSPLAEGEMDRLQDVRVDLALGLPDRVTLRFRDDAAMTLSNSTTFQLGKALQVSLAGVPAPGAASPRPAKVFEGEVTEIDAAFRDGEAPELTVTALELAHRLTHGTTTRSFQKVSDGDVVKTIAGERNLKAHVSPAFTKAVHDYLLQSCTDYAFLSERARAAGARWYVEDGTLHFVDTVELPGTTPPKLTWGKELRSFTARSSVAEAAAGVRVRGWDPKVQKAVSADQPIDAAALLVGTPLAKEAQAAGAKMGGSRFRGEASATSAAEAKAVGTGLIRRAGAEMATAKGECLGNPLLMPGIELDVAGVGTRTSGTYLCTGVSHVVSGRHRYVTRFECGGSDPRGLVDLLGGSGTGVRARVDATASWADRGLVIGIVTNVRDPEKLGRVRVSFPTLSDDVESAWARVLSTGAGTSRGVQSTPEAKDEVLVGFEHGDPRRPVVLGGLWSSKNKPPAEADTATRKLLTIRSLRGSELVLEDTTDKKNQFRVELRDTGGLFQLGQVATKLLSPSAITIQGDRDITIKAIGKLVLDAQEIQLVGKAKIALGAPVVETKADALASVEAGVLQLKGKGSAKVESAGVTEVKGSLLKLN